MRRRTIGLFGLVFLVIFLFAARDGAAMPDRGGHEAPADEQEGRFIDDFPHPLGLKRRALMRQAVVDKVLGRTEGRVVEVAEGEFVELAREGEDLIWTVLADFGDEEHSSYTGGQPGPQHNEIPEPDRAVDNANIWVPDFSPAYYLELLFSDAPGAVSVRNFYKEQSSGRYTVDGEVTEWGKVRYNTARYGRDHRGSWHFVDEAVDDWYQSQLDAGKTAAEIDTYLSRFDIWDRYDYDGDGDFDEADGYIDHFQAVHAGFGEEAGGGSYGSDTIWSHRSYVFYDLAGSTGPDFNLKGGAQIGGSVYWIGDYTIEPENGGVGVFAHEFAHDLDLPDLYGPSADNGVGFWSLMGHGSWLSDGGEDIGSKPSHLGAWEKLQLDWLNYETAYAGQRSVHKLGPAEHNTEFAQALLVILPERAVATAAGSASFFNAYLAEYRQYVGFDDSLRDGPYNFGFAGMYNFVERFPYQDGLLINYWDSSQTNNNTQSHPGEGLILPIDAHPERMIRADGGSWRARVQTYDATFGLEPTDAVELHHNSQPSYHESLRPVREFNDRKQYWNPETPYAGVKNPHTGTRIRILNVDEKNGFMLVNVRPERVRIAGVTGVTISDEWPVVK